MGQAHDIVKFLLETGEPDQDYDHDTFNFLVKKLAKAGFRGARHREFDKYQGVYLVVPGVDKFWASYDGGPLALVPENDRRLEAGATMEIPVQDEEGELTAKYLIDYIRERIRIPHAHAKAQASAEDFIDSRLGQ